MMIINKLYSHDSWNKWRNLIKTYIWELSIKYLILNFFKEEGAYEKYRGRKNNRKKVERVF